MSDEAASEGNPIVLNASGSKAAERTTVTLQWAGTDAVGMVVVYRNGEVLTTTADDTIHTDVIEGSARSLTYRICEEGTTRCSNEAKLF